jgi:hypothetical protein
VGRRTFTAHGGRVPPARRRRRAVATAAVTVAAPALWWAVGGTTAASGPPPAGTVPDVAEGADRTAGEVTDLTAGEDDGPPASEDSEAPATSLLGRFDDLPVHLPAAAPLVVGYHEASAATALDVQPVGQLVEDRNTTRTDLPADTVGGPRYVVLSSRGRAAGPTSAIDVVLPEGEPVLASVTGTVVDVRSYLLYGAHQDVRIEIVPTDRPAVRLVGIHLDGPLVEVGDEVVGGVTPIATTARTLPFSSHIDRETEPDRHPHVHLEFQPVGLPRPGDEDGAADADGAEGADADREGAA